MEKNTLAAIAVIAVVAVVGGAAFVIMNNGGDNGNNSGNNGGDNSGGGDGDGSGDGGATTVSSYSISFDASDAYTVRDLPTSANNGEDVSFYVVPNTANTEIDLRILDASNNRVQCTSSGNKYTFSMPASNVRLAITTNNIPDNTNDNFLTWAADNATTIEVWHPQFEGDSYYNPYDGSTLTANVTGRISGGPYGKLFVHTESARSLNGDVIPNSAITLDYNDTLTGTGGDSAAVSFDILIDRTQVSTGTATIVLTVNNGHKFGDSSELVTTITVIETGRQRP